MRAVRPPGEQTASWALSIDVDEYLAVKNRDAQGPFGGRTAIPERLASAELDSTIGCEFMHHRQFGSAGLFSKPLGSLTTATATTRSKDPGGNGKSWVRVDALRKNIGPHYFAQVIHMPSKGMLHGPLGQRRCRDNDAEAAETGVMIFHYFTGTYQRFIKTRLHHLRAVDRPKFWENYDEVFDGTLVGHSIELYHILHTTDPWWTNRTMVARKAMPSSANNKWVGTVTGDH